MAMDARTVTEVAVTCRLDELVLDCLDPPRLAEFWSQALGYDVYESDPELSAIEDPSGQGPSICFQKVAEAKLVKNRMHFDLNVDDDALEDAVERLLAIGAHTLDVGQGVDRSWVVMCDPEGNEFCVVC